MKLNPAKQQQSLYVKRKQRTVSAIIIKTFVAVYTVFQKTQLGLLKVSDGSIKSTAS